MTKHAPTLALAVALSAAVPSAAFAALPLLPAGDAGIVQPVSPPGGHFAYTVKLVGGHDYAMVSMSEANVLGVLHLIRAGGTDLIGAGLCSQDEITCGLSFRAPYTGDYTLDVTIDDRVPAPTSFWVAFPSDCGNNLTTHCHLGANQTLTGRAINYQLDRDTYRTTLKAGSRYDFSLQIEPGSPVGSGQALLPLRVLDTRGRVLAQAATGGGAPVTGFAPPKDGTYFFQVSDDCCFETLRYSVTETRHR